MKNSKVLTGILLGAVIGMAAGVLLAPEKGSKLRKKLLKKKEEYADLFKGKFDDLLAELCEKYEMTKEEAINLIEKYTDIKNEQKEAGTH